MASVISKASRKLLAPGLIALALLGFAMAQAAPAMAFASVSTSVGVSCSMKNGVATLKVRAKAVGATVDHLTIDIDRNGNDEALFDSSTDFDETLTVSPAAAGNYTIVITIGTTDAPDRIKNGSATITANRCSARVG